jgi:hypothetical protein
MLEPEGVSSWSTLFISPIRFYILCTEAETHGLRSYSLIHKMLSQSVFQTPILSLSQRIHSIASSYISITQTHQGLACFIASGIPSVFLLLYTPFKTRLLLKQERKISNHFGRHAKIVSLHEAEVTLAAINIMKDLCLTTSFAEYCEIHPVGTLSCNITMVYYYTTRHFCFNCSTSIVIFWRRTSNTTFIVNISLFSHFDIGRCLAALDLRDNKYFKQ